MKRSLESRMRYNKEHTIQYGFRLNKRTDEDIIKMLESRTSKMGYVKSLIRRDIKRREERRAKGIRGLEVMLGPNTNQYWVYDDIDDVFIDPPKELAYDEEALNKALEDFPDWLFDEAYRYYDEDFEI